MLQQRSAQPAYSKPRVNDFSYTAESSSCLYRIMSSSRPKSTLVDGGLLSEDFSSATLLCDIIIDEESVIAGEDASLIRATMSLGLMRRRSGDRSANPDAEGRLAAIMATIATKVVTELKIRWFIIAALLSILNLLLILWEVVEESESLDFSRSLLCNSIPSWQANKFVCGGVEKI